MRPEYLFITLFFCLCLFLAGSSTLVGANMQQDAKKAVKDKVDQAKDKVDHASETVHKAAKNVVDKADEELKYASKSASQASTTAQKKAAEAKKDASDWLSSIHPQAGSMLQRAKDLWYNNVFSHSVHKYSAFDQIVDKVKELAGLSQKKADQVVKKVKKEL